MEENPPAESTEDRGHVIGVGMGGACPNCRAPVELGQKFCLECGAAIRFSRKAKVAQNMPRARTDDRTFPWLPFVGVLVLLLLGVGAVLWNNSKSTTKHHKAKPSTLSTGDDPTVPATTLPTEPSFPSDTTTTGTIPTATDTTTTPTSTSTGTPNTDSSTWPSGKNGWTVVLASLSKSLYSQDDANQRAVEAQQHSVTGGVLNSDEFSNLQAGFWVVFSGVYDSKSQAEGHLPDVTSAGYQGYVRQIISG